MRVLASMLPIVAAVAAVAAQVLPSARLSGRVVDERTRFPIPGARVSLFYESANTPQPVQQTITDQDGRYAFEGVAAGQYRVYVQKSGILPLADAVWARIVRVTDGQDVEDWNVPVQRGGAIAGRILDQFGEPLAEVTIRAMRQEKAGTVPSQSTVNRPPRSDLRFTNDLGEFRVLAERPQWDGYQNISANMTLQASTFYPGVSDSSAAQPISVSSGETTSGVEFRLLTNPGFTLAGVIVDQAGTPVGGMLVILRADPHFDASGGVVEGPVGISSSDPNGRFVLGNGNLASGAYHVGVEAPQASLRKALLDGSVGSYLIIGGVPPAPGADPMALTVNNANIEDLKIVLQFIQSR
jgi:5-hydroxyisourate hydrolase-like protein (transthyretin family)